MSWPNDVTKADLEVTFFTGSGAGGQRRNRRKTACRIKHVPTGEAAECQDHAHGAQNRREAFKRLAAKLVPLMVPSAEPRRIVLAQRPIRTYHDKRGTAKDHRTGKEAPLERVLDGDLDLLLDRD